MLGIKELKEKIEITKTTVECPFKGCKEVVERQRRVFRKENRFKCSKHNIFISPSTFEYFDESDNFLWKEKSDIELFKKIKKVKRESRMARNNSEDKDIILNYFRNKTIGYDVYRRLQRAFATFLLIYFREIRISGLILLA